MACGILYTQESVKLGPAICDSRTGWKFVDSKEKKQSRKIKAVLT
jgi:hypothetical protein